MIKTLIKTITILFVIIFAVIIYLSFYGISTKSFNNEIKSQILNINKTINLELKSVRFLLEPLNLSINIKTFEPELFIKGRKLELEFIKTNISLKSFINKEFLIDDLQISTKRIELKDLTSLARSLSNSTELFLLDSAIKGGVFVGDIDLYFNKRGKIKDDYEIKGFIQKAKLNILRKYIIDDLKFIFKVKDKQYYIEELEGVFNQVRLSSKLIKVKEENNEFLINGKLVSKKEKVNAKVLNSLFKNNFKDFNIEYISFDSDSDFTFVLNKKLKISDFRLKSKIELKELVYKNNLINIKNYLPDFNELIKLEDHIVSVNYKKNQLDIDGRGTIIVEDNVDNLDYKIKKQNNQYIFDTNININQNPLTINALQYQKKKNVNSLLKLKGVYKKNKQIEFNLISFSENDNNFLINDLNLNNKYKVLDIKVIELNYVNENEIKNQINIKKNKKEYNIRGKKFDFSRTVEEILNSDNTESVSMFDSLDTNINIKINKIYLDNDTFVNNLSGNINFKDNKINKLNLDSTFPNNKKLILTIMTNEKNEKITTLFSNYPKPLIKQYKFIKGFDEGVLDFYSIKKDGLSKSLLTIDNFKIKEVPVFAKLLSLASLQGIADLLTGEGIRFTDFEMKFSNIKELMTIEEMYAIGPAVSILMDGYIDDQNLISLRGTLVPATTINRSIASIPLIGNILVGKKTGEGVFGVSFKIKGYPSDLKTKVNPVKTLTPRFITRTLEKIKKN
jgi:hypothetical protein